MSSSEDVSSGISAFPDIEPRVVRTDVVTGRVMHNQQKSSLLLTVENDAGPQYLLDIRQSTRRFSLQRIVDSKAIH